MLKLVDVLTAALRSTADDGKADDVEVDSASFDLSSHADAIKNTRSLASLITSRGSALHGILGREPELREAKADAIARNLDVDDIEAAVSRATALVKEEIARTKVSQSCPRQRLCDLPHRTALPTLRRHATARGQEAVRI
jgi:clusterin-associated protein 1